MSDNSQAQTTLLDVYAGMALQALLTHTTRLYIDTDGKQFIVMEELSSLSGKCFDIAEAMLAERARRVPA